MARIEKEEAQKLADAYLGWHDIRKRETPDKAAAIPLGDRIIIRQRPPDLKKNEIWIPEKAQEIAFEGVIVSAGNSAADKLHDEGYMLGDRVWYGQYAGIRETWVHYIAETVTEETKTCDHDFSSFEARLKIDYDRCQGLRCPSCGLVRIEEPIVIMTVKDILSNVDLQLRLEKGVARRIRGTTDEGQTQYITQIIGECTAVEDWEIDNAIKGEL